MAVSNKLLGFFCFFFVFSAITPTSSQQIVAWSSIMTYGGTMQLNVSSNVPVVREQSPWTDCPINTAGKFPNWPEDNNRS